MQDNPQVSVYHYNDGPQAHSGANPQVSTYHFNDGAQAAVPNPQVSVYHYNDGAQAAVPNPQVSVYHYNDGAQPAVPNPQVSVYHFNDGALAHSGANPQVSTYHYNDGPHNQLAAVLPAQAPEKVSTHLSPVYWVYGFRSHRRQSNQISSSRFGTKFSDWVWRSREQQVRASPGHLLMCGHAVLAGLVSATDRLLKTGDAGTACSQPAPHRHHVPI